MKRRETIVIPMQRKKKVGTVADRSKGIPMSEVRALQFATEQVVKRLAAAEKQLDGLAKLDKEKSIEINRLRLVVQRVEKSQRERDAE